MINIPVLWTLHKPHFKTLQELPLTNTLKKVHDKVKPLNFIRFFIDIKKLFFVYLIKTF